MGQGQWSEKTLLVLENGVSKSFAPLITWTGVRDSIDHWRAKGPRFNTEEDLRTAARRVISDYLSGKGMTEEEYNVIVASRATKTFTKRRQREIVRLEAKRQSESSSPGVSKPVSLK